MRTNIIVTLQYEATHNWPDCDDPIVGYLKHEHRHMFHIVCKKQVSHDDRDIEIITMKSAVLLWLAHTYGGELKAMSCEMLARKIAEVFHLSYCSCMEDGENGAEVIDDGVKITNN